MAARTMLAVPSGELSSTTRMCMSCWSRPNSCFSDARSAAILPLSLYVGRMITTFIDSVSHGILKPIMPNRPSLAVFLILLTLARSASAWNSAGHMMVAAVAYERLTPEAHARVSHLLQLNPDYSKWIEHASGADRDRIAFVMAATWPDEIKSERDCQNDGER